MLDPVRLPLSVERRHLVAGVGGRRLIVDTGSPASFGSGGTLRIGDTDFPVPASALGVTVAQLREQTGLAIDGLVGTDVLGAFDLVFDVREGVIQLHSGAVPRPAGAGTTSRMMGAPIVGVRADGRACSAFLDSGAQYSYLPECFSSAGPTARVEDFHPFLGRYEIALRPTLIPLMVGGVAYDAHEHAVPPPLLAAALAAASVEGIIGVAVFESKKVALSLREGWWACA